MSLFALFLACLTAACAGPCEQLANIVCDCDEDPNQKTACRNQVATDVRRIQISDADNRLCEQKMKICTRNGTDNCGAIRAGDRNACGFTKE